MSPSSERYLSREDLVKLPSLSVAFFKTDNPPKIFLLLIWANLFLDSLFLIFNISSSLISSGIFAKEIALANLSASSNLSMSLRLLVEPHLVQ